MDLQDSRISFDWGGLIRDFAVLSSLSKTVHKYDGWTSSDEWACSDYRFASFRGRLYLTFRSSGGGSNWYIPQS